MKSSLFCYPLYNRHVEYHNFVWGVMILLHRRVLVNSSLPILSFIAPTWWQLYWLFFIFIFIYIIIAVCARVCVSKTKNANRSWRAIMRGSCEWSERSNLHWKTWKKSGLSTVFTVCGVHEVSRAYVRSRTSLTLMKIRCSEDPLQRQLNFIDSKVLVSVSFEKGAYLPLWLAMACWWQRTGSEIDIITISGSSGINLLSTPTTTTGLASARTAAVAAAAAGSLTGIANRRHVPIPIHNSHRFTFTTPRHRQSCRVCLRLNYSHLTSRLVFILIISCPPSCRPPVYCQCDTTSLTRSQICQLIYRASFMRPASKDNNHLLLLLLGRDGWLLLLALLSPFVLNQSTTCPAFKWHVLLCHSSFLTFYVGLFLSFRHGGYQSHLRHWPKNNRTRRSCRELHRLVVLSYCQKDWALASTMTG